jgi:hypothetical protein
LRVEEVIPSSDLGFQFRFGFCFVSSSSSGFMFALWQSVLGFLPSVLALRDGGLD